MREAIPANDYDKTASLLMTPDSVAISPALINELVSQTRSGPNVEPPTAAMFSALLQYDETSIVRQQLLAAASGNMIRRNVAPGAAASALRTSLVNYFRRRFSQDRGVEFSDINLTRADQWTQYFDMLEEDISTDQIGVAEADTTTMMAVSEMLNIGVTFLEAATPAKTRYLIPELYTQLIKERFPDGARALDIGSSVMWGPLYLMNKAKLFPIEFESVSYRSTESGTHRDITEATNALLEQPQPFSEFVCVDTIPFYYEDRQEYDQGFASLAMSGLRPSERHNPWHLDDLETAMALKNKRELEYSPDSGVTFHTSNLLDDHDLAGFREAHPGTYDVIIMNYITQELSPHQRLKMHAVAMSLLSENGIIAYSHQAHIPRGRTQPAPIESVKHFSSYAMRPWVSYSHVVDNLQTPGVQEMAKSYDNRWQRAVRLGIGKLVVNGSAEPIIELIKGGA